jgi:hypothetical protein
MGSERAIANPATAIRRKFVTIFTRTSCTGERLGQVVCLIYKAPA